MQFTPTIMGYYPVNPDSEHLISGNIILKPVGERGCLKSPFGFKKNPRYKSVGDFCLFL
jgi:hypothetical protein